MEASMGWISMLENADAHAAEYFSRAVNHLPASEQIRRPTRSEALRRLWRTAEVGEAGHSTHAA
jgi:hypothetical protein